MPRNNGGKPDEIVAGPGEPAPGGDGTIFPVGGATAVQAEPYGEDFLQTIVGIHWPGAAAVGVGLPCVVGDFCCSIGYSLDGKSYVALDEDLFGGGGSIHCGGWFRRGFVPDGKPVWLMGGGAGPGAIGGAAVFGGCITYSLDCGQDGCFYANYDPPIFGYDVPYMSFDKETKAVYALVESTNQNPPYNPIWTQYKSVDGINWIATGQTSDDVTANDPILPGTASPGLLAGPMGTNPETDQSNYGLFQASTTTAFGKDGVGQVAIIVNGGNVTRNGVDISGTILLNEFNPNPPAGGDPNDNFVGGTLSHNVVPYCVASDGKQFFILAGGSGGAAIAWSDDAGITWTGQMANTNKPDPYYVTGGRFQIFAIAAGPPEGWKARKGAAGTIVTTGSP